MWNHRVIRRKFDCGDYEYAIHEVYYNEADLPVSCTVNPVEPYGETEEELRNSIIRMLAATLKPTLNFEEIGGNDGIEQEDSSEDSETSSSC
jgi:hypothetical protein